MTRPTVSTSHQLLTDLQHNNSRATFCRAPKKQIHDRGICLVFKEAASPYSSFCAKHVYGAFGACLDLQV